MPLDPSEERLEEGTPVGGGGGGTVDVSEGGTQVLADAADLNFTQSGIAAVSVTDDGDGTASVDVSADVADNSIGNLEVDNSDSFIWQNQHDWERAQPSSGVNPFIRLVDTTAAANARWVVDTNGNISLRSSDGTSNTIYSFAPGGSGIDYSEAIRPTAGIEQATRVDFGSNSEIRTEYQSGDDAFAIRDQTNTADRVQVDRTTGDHTIEGTYTEGAAL